MTYTIEWKDGTWSRDVNKFADHYNAYCQIRIANDVPNCQIADSILHEILHAIWDILNIEDAKNEEDTIRRLSPAMCMFWRDNPEFSDWWRLLLS